MYVKELKERYVEVVDMPIDSIRFVCGGTECQDDSLLVDVGIGQDTPVFAVF